MVRNLVFVWSLVALIGVTACSEGVGASDGLDVYAVLRPPQHRSQIRERLGRIEMSVPLKKEVRASDVPLLRNAMAAMERHTDRVIADAALWGYEDYEVLGPTREPGDWTDVGINGGMTADAGRWNDGKRDPRKRVQRFRVWYRKDQVYFAHQKFFDSDWAAAPWPPAFLRAVREQVAFGVERKGQVPTVEKENLDTKKPGR